MSQYPNIKDSFSFSQNYHSKSSGKSDLGRSWSNSQHEEGALSNPGTSGQNYLGYNISSGSANFYPANTAHGSKIEMESINSGDRRPFERDSSAFVVSAQGNSAATFDRQEASQFHQRKTSNFASTQPAMAIQTQFPAFYHQNHTVSLNSPSDHRPSTGIQYQIPSSTHTPGPYQFREIPSDYSYSAASPSGLTPLPSSIPLSHELQNYRQSTTYSALPSASHYVSSSGYQNINQSSSFSAPSPSFNLAAPEQSPDTSSIPQFNDFYSDKRRKSTPGLHSTADFVRKVYKLLDDGDYGKHLRWNLTGTSFIIFEQNDFAKNVLPKHFKHSNFSSFVRQLNKYDFHKIRASHETRAYGDGAWEFHHPYFQRDNPALMASIKRKVKPSARKYNAGGEIIREIVEHEDDEENVKTSPSIAPISSVTPPPSTDTSAKSTTPQPLIEKDVVSADHINAVIETQRLMALTLEKLGSQFKSLSQTMCEFKHTLDLQDTTIDALLKDIPGRSSTPGPTVFMNRQSFEEMVLTSKEYSRLAKNQLTGMADQLDALLREMTPKDSAKAGSSNNLYESAAKSQTFETEETTLIKKDVKRTLKPSWAVAPKVLLVEDDPTCRSLSSKLLQIFGCSFDIATDGLAAVNKMNLSQYDLVLMDIVMPNLDGVSATHHIRKFDQLTPIISMTSNTTETDCSIYLSTGMTDILAKPFSKANLFDILQRYCSHLNVASYYGQHQEQLNGEPASKRIQTPIFTWPSGTSLTDVFLSALPGGNNTEDEALRKLLSGNWISQATLQDLKEEHENKDILESSRKEIDDEEEQEEDDDDDMKRKDKKPRVK